MMSVKISTMFYQKMQTTFDASAVMTLAVSCARISVVGKIS